MCLCSLNACVVVFGCASACVWLYVTSATCDLFTVLTDAGCCAQSSHQLLPVAWCSICWTRCNSKTQHQSNNTHTHTHTHSQNHFLDRVNLIHSILFSKVAELWRHLADAFIQREQGSVWLHSAVMEIESVLHNRTLSWVLHLWLFTTFT